MARRAEIVAAMGADMYRGIPVPAETELFVSPAHSNPHFLYLSGEAEWLKRHEKLMWKKDVHDAATAVRLKLYEPFMGSQRLQLIEHRAVERALAAREAGERRAAERAVLAQEAAGRAGAMQETAERVVFAQEAAERIVAEREVAAQEAAERAAAAQKAAEQTAAERAVAAQEAAERTATEHTDRAPLASRHISCESVMVFVPVLRPN